MGPDDMPVWQPYTSESVTCVGSVKADDENRAWTCEEKEGPTSTPSEPVFMARCRDSKTATTDWFVSDRVQPLIGDPCQAQ